VNGSRPFQEPEPGDSAPVPTPADPASRGSALAAALLTYGTNLAVAVLSLVNVLVVARALGPSARGSVAFLITVATMTGQFACLSVQEANANLGGSNPAARGRLATNSLILAVVLGAVASIIVVTLVSVFPAVGGPVSRTLLLVALAAVPFVIVKTFLSFLLQAEYAFVSTNLAWLAGPLLGAIVNSVFALTGWLTITTAFVVWVAGQALGVVILLVRVRRGAGLARPDGQLAGDALRFGMKTHPGRLMGMGNYRADQWFVGSISGSKELGLYSVATSWAEMLFYLPGVLTLVQRPDLVRASPEEAARRAARVFRIATIATAVAAAGLIVIAPLLVTVVFGDAFAGAVPMLRILALGALGIAALDLLPNALTAQRMPIRGMWAIAVAFAVTLVLDISLVPPFGGMGASVATAVAYSIGGASAAVIFARALHVPLRELVPRLNELPWLWHKLRSLLRRAPERP
jgi:O-antigen/teichoic acid export membrane protein